MDTKGCRGNIELPMYKELKKGQRITEVIKSYKGERELQRKFIVKVIREL